MPVREFLRKPRDSAGVGNNVQSISGNPALTSKLKRGAAALCAAVGLVLGLAAPVSAEDPPAPTGVERWLDNEYFKVYLNVRARMELADFDGLSSSQAYTVRTRLGLGNKPWHGLSVFVEGENIFSFADGEYFDTVESPTGQTPIADPEETELNQLFLRYQNPDLLGLNFVGGRQRIILDDARFVGNVGWRQNEQTFDSALLAFSPVEHLTATYAYLWDIRRIFGENSRDLDSQSHVINVSYDGLAAAKIVAFAYLLDFDNSRQLAGFAREVSSNSYGFRGSGKQAISGPWSVNYAGSYAVQTDAGDNPVSYTAHYVAAEAGLGNSDLGVLAVGYELLGSDDGQARFVTPLATLHKFNGWADAFLDNGGPDGLQDLYVSVAPKLPWGLKGKVVYHHFWSHEGTDSLADEVDFVLSKPINKYLTVLTKGAWFDGKSGSGRTDGWRYWLEVTFTY
jgi:hypothetical protein